MEELAFNCPVMDAHQATFSSTPPLLSRIHGDKLQLCLLHLPSFWIPQNTKSWHRHLGPASLKLLHCCEAYPHIQRMLQEMCECAKGEMKAMAAEEIGSWQIAVTSADRCWLTRGQFSQNFTFIVKNYKRTVWPPLHTWE